jgi:hypothetical protein
MFTLQVCALFLAFLSVQGAPTGQWFDRIFFIAFENQGFTPVATNPDFAAMSKKGMLLNNSFAISHPSQPNYLAIGSGSTQGITGNGLFNISAPCLVDLFEAAGLSWKLYQEAFPSPCFLGLNQGTYWQKHNPFISFSSVNQNATRCAKIVNSAGFLADLGAGTLPQYSFYTPDINNDGHDTGVAFAGTYLANFLRPTVLAQFPPKTLIVVWWDEEQVGGPESNRIYNFLLSPDSTIPANSFSNTRYDHYSFVRLVEDNWALGNLGVNDVSATPVSLVPTGFFTAAPTKSPVAAPTKSPVAGPTAKPTPSKAPTKSPTTRAPNNGTVQSPNYIPVGAIVGIVLLSVLIGLGILVCIGVLIYAKSSEGFGNV